MNEEITKKLKEFAEEFKVQSLLDMIEQEQYFNNNQSYTDLIDYLQINVLGFCGCGNPEENVKYVADSLKLLRKYNSFGSTFGMTEEDIEKDFEEFQQAEKEFFGNDLQANFMYYYLDSEEFTEHGGSIPGWVDEKGHQFIELFDMIDKLNKDE